MLLPARSGTMQKWCVILTTVTTQSPDPTPDPTGVPAPAQAQVPLDPAAAAAGSNAYYAREINKPETARSRAQAGFGVTSAVATVLIAAGVLAKFQTLSLWVLVPGLIAVGLWLATAALFLWTVSMPIRRLPAELAQPGNLGALDFLDKAVRGANWQARKINFRLAIAAWVTSAAAVLTLASLVLAATVSAPDPRTEVADLSLANRAFAVVSRICPSAVLAPKPLNLVVGAIDPSESDDEFVSLRLASRECPGATSLDVPRSEIRAILTHDNCTFSQLSLPSSSHAAGAINTPILSSIRRHAGATPTVSPSPSPSLVPQKINTCFPYSGEP
jgi:hypothetical protein